MQDIKRLRIFISSPGDVRDERTIAAQLIERLRYDPFIVEQADLQVVSWDRPAYPAPLIASTDPQTAINTALPRPSECDITIVILWSKLGTPLPPAHYSKPTGDQYRSGTEWEFIDALESSKSTGRPVLLVYRRTSPVTVELDDIALDEKKTQYNKLRAFLGELEMSGVTKRINSYSTYHTTEEFRSRLETDLRMVVARLCASPSVQGRQGESGRGWDPARSPFLGLRAFTPADAILFFGRDRECDSLIRVLSRTPVVAVVGPSGCGKSSLIGAGLLPRLAMGALPGSERWLLPSASSDGKAWFGPRLTPAEIGRDPSRALELALSRSEVASCRSEYPQETASDIEALCRRSLESAGASGEILLFVDQFEELFTIVDKHLRASIIDTLLLTVNTGLARLVITLRADFFGHALEQEALASYFKDGTLPLAKPGLRALLEMITRPAKLAGLEFDPDLPEAILVDAGTDPGSLPLMSYVLEELYRVRRGARLSRDAYDELGGIIGAVGNRAERQLAGFDESVRASLPNIFRSLVEVDQVGRPVRRRALLNKLITNNEDQQLMDSLIAIRLLVAGSDAERRPTVELAHEALLWSWRRLAGWLASVHSDMVILRRLQIAADDWNGSGRDPQLLWPHERLVPVYEMIESLTPELTEIEQAFVRPEADRLLEELEDSETPHRRRAAIGDRLAAIGDPRPGVALRSDGLPDLVWCPVYRQKQAATARPSFYISKYPITVAQLDAYRAASYLADIEVRGRGPLTLWANRPAATNYQEAMAFCNWMTREMRRRVSPSLSADYPSSWEVRLPTEFEWEFAATEGRSYLFPWGSEWDDARANSAKSKLARTVAVGMYPSGAAPTGALDMCGNVWEWCYSDMPSVRNASLPAETVNTETYDGNAGLGLGPLRGASFRTSPSYCTVTHRLLLRRDVVDSDRGFRACLAPIEDQGRDE